MRRCLALLLWLVLCTGCAQTPARAQATWTPRFEQADIYEFIELVHQATGKTFVMSPDMAIKVTITDSKSLSADELYKLLKTTLESNGYTATETDNIVRILPVADGATAQ